MWCGVPEALSNHDRRRKNWPKYDRGIGKIDLKKTGVFLQGSSKLAFLKLGFTLLTSLGFFVSFPCFDFNFLRYLRILSKNPQAVHSRRKRVHSHSKFDSSFH